MLRIIFGPTPAAAEVVGSAPLAMEQTLTQKASDLLNETRKYNAGDEKLDMFISLKMNVLFGIVKYLENYVSDTPLILDGRDDLLAYPVDFVGEGELTVERSDAIRTSLRFDDEEKDLFSDFFDLSEYGATKHTGPVVYIFDENTKEIDDETSSVDGDDPRLNVYFEEDNKIFTLVTVRSANFLIDIDSTNVNLIERTRNFINYAHMDMEEGQLHVFVTDDPTVSGSYILEIPVNKRLEIASKVLQVMENTISSYRK